MSLAFLLTDADPAERSARLRELRLLAAIFLGRGNVATRALTEAVADGAAAERALQLLDEAAALPRRRILAIYGSLMPPSRRETPSAGRSV